MAEQWAVEWCRDHQFDTTKDRGHSFLAGLAKAAEIIEASPTVRMDEDTADGVWMIDMPQDCSHQAKLVGVKPIREDT